MADVKMSVLFCLPMEDPVQRPSGANKWRSPVADSKVWMAEVQK